MTIAKQPDEKKLVLDSLKRNPRLETLEMAVAMSSSEGVGELAQQRPRDCWQDTRSRRQGPRALVEAAKVVGVAWLDEIQRNSRRGSDSLFFVLLDRDPGYKL